MILWLGDYDIRVFNPCTERPHTDPSCGLTDAPSELSLYLNKVTSSIPVSFSEHLPLVKQISIPEQISETAAAMVSYQTEGL